MTDTGDFMLGYDYEMLDRRGIKVPLAAPVESHLIAVGSSGSGKSTALLYWLYKIRKHKCRIYIADFKKSREFCGITGHCAEFEECHSLVREFYEDFMSTPEGGDRRIKILLIDEIAGMLAHLSLTKEGKQKADEIRNIMSSVLMLGRSRKCFLWLSMQRYTASIFPASSGSADNFHICAGFGRLTPDGRKGLFAGEHLDSEEELMFGQGRGIVLIDGQPLKALAIPRASKSRLLHLMQK